VPRRWRPLLASLLLVPPFTGCGGEGSPPPAPSAPPNLVLVTIDTLRADRLPAWGYEGVETPHLDGLVRAGIRFSQAVSTVPFTLPAHSSILTGRYPPAHGVRENVGYVLGEGLPTLAEMAAAAGYDTGGFVSSFVLDGRWGIGRGFDTYFDDFDAPPGERANMGSVQRDGAETVAAALAWLDRRSAERSFLLWLHLYEPHDPYTPPEPFASRHAGRPYDGEIAYADELLGRLVRGLRERDLYATTALAVTADHGEGLGDHGEAFHGFFVYDSTMHVPLVLRLPGDEQGGRVVTTPVSHVDLLPTLLGLAGVTPPTAIDGASLLPLARGEQRSPRPLYSESLYPLLHYGWAPLRALRDGTLKYIEAPLPELFDIDADPVERQNLVRGRRADVDRLRGDLDRLREQLEAAPAAAAEADLDEETLARLQALGYLAGGGALSPADEGERERADPKTKIELHRLVMAAQSALGAGDEELARHQLEAAVREDADLLDAHQMLGSLDSRAGDQEAAVARFSRALELDAEHTASLFGLAAAYRRLGRMDEALLGFERLLSLSPRDTKAALAASEILVAQRQLPRALELLERAAEGREAPALLDNLRGEVLVLMERRDEGRRAFEHALETEPELAQPHFNLGVLAEEAGDAAAAAAHYRRAVDLAPSHFQARFNLGLLYGGLGRAAEQQEQWEAAIAANPDFVRGYYFLAKLLMDRGGDLTRAEELTRAGLARDERHVAGPLGYYLLADLLNRQGRSAEAREAHDRGREIEGSSGP
jgi:arylsulfatase A-like enzyme/Flp pilus assembly protein TadD